MKKKIFIIVTIVFHLFIFSSFIVKRIHKKDKSKSDAAESFDVVPQRIISLAPNLTEILFSLGLEKQVVGVSSLSNYPSDAMSKPKVGSFWQPDIEAVLALQPDLVVTLQFAQQIDLAEKLQSDSLRTITVDITTIQQMLDAIETIARVTHRQKQARILIENFQSQKMSIQETYQGKSPVKVLWVIQRDPFRVAGPDTFIQEILETVGAENAIGSSVYEYPPLSKEEVIGSAADVIIEPADQSEIRESLEKSTRSFYSQFTTLPAVKNHRIYIINGDLVSRLSPRLITGFQEVAHCIWQKKSGALKDETEQ